VNCGLDTGWVALADPEGDEFCILRSHAEVNGKFQREHCDIESVSGVAGPSPSRRRRGSRV